MFYRVQLLKTSNRMNMKLSNFRRKIHKLIISHHGAYDQNADTIENSRMHQHIVVLETKSDVMCAYNYALHKSKTFNYCLSQNSINFWIEYFW